MPFLFGNLFRDDVDHEEGADQDGRDDDQREPRNDVRDCIERLAVKDRGMRLSWQRQHGKRDQGSEATAATTPRICGALNDYVVYFTLHGLFYLSYRYKLSNLFVQSRQREVNSKILSFPTIG